MRFTQLTQSITKKSCSLPVRGETARSERTVKMRKSPSDWEPICCQGLIICDSRFTIQERHAISRVTVAPRDNPANGKSEIANSNSFFLRRPAFLHEIEQMRQCLLVAPSFPFSELPGPLIQLRRHFGGLFRRATQRGQPQRQFGSVQGIHDLRFTIYAPNDSTPWRMFGSLRISGDEPIVSWRRTEEAFELRQSWRFWILFRARKSCIVNRKSQIVHHVTASAETRVMLSTPTRVVGLLFSPLLL